MWEVRSSHLCRVLLALRHMEEDVFERWSAHAEIFKLPSILCLSEDSEQVAESANFVGVSVVPEMIGHCLHVVRLGPALFFHVAVSESGECLSSCSRLLRRICGLWLRFLSLSGSQRARGGDYVSLIVHVSELSGSSVSDELAVDHDGDSIA